VSLQIDIPIGTAGNIKGATMKNFTAIWNSGDAKEQVEEILLANKIFFDELESPAQRANGSHVWLASYKNSPVAEVNLMFIN
jgi:hypothetical protein